MCPSDRIEPEIDQWLVCSRPYNLESEFFKWALSWQGRNAHLELLMTLLLRRHCLALPCDIEAPSEAAIT